MSIIALFVCSVVLFAKEKKDSATLALERRLKFMDSVDAAMKYETGTIALLNGVAHLTIPKGFKYLNVEQSNYVVSDVWENPPRPDLLGN